jgi:hypothetical protein
MANRERDREISPIPQSHLKPPLQHCQDEGLCNYCKPLQLFECASNY